MNWTILKQGGSSSMLLSCFLLILISMQVQAQTAFDSVAGDPLKVQMYTLDNGLKVYLSVNKDEPRIQTAIPVRVGCKQDPRETTGLAHYLEHMLFKGTDQVGTSNWEEEKVLLDQIRDLYEAHMKEDEPEKKKAIYAQIDSVSFEASKLAVPNEYDKMVSSLGAKYTNAYTSTDQTVYINNIPANELEKWLKLESERFRMLVLRLFHTELEAVYEEFNMSQDRDGSKVYQAMLKRLFPNHPYSIPTIGTGEHLKNPSLVEIQKFFDTYYVANNMAIVLAGDFEPESTIKMIKKYFGDMRSGEVPEWSFKPEPPMTENITTEVFGQEAGYVNLYYRFKGAGSKEAKILKLMDAILANGQAGLMDLNLIQKQKILDGGCYQYSMVDYSIHVLNGKAREGQSLEEVRDLLLEQIELLKAGKFDDWLIDAVIKDFKLSEIKGYESNWLRNRKMVSAFIENRPWSDYVNEMDELSKITKQDIVEFVNKHYDHYVAVFKRQGDDDSAYKVEKPPITPIEMERANGSDFYNEFNAMGTDRLKPVFLDYAADIKKETLKTGVDMNYIKNETNATFNLYYILDMGTRNDKMLGLAIKYLPYLGTSKYSAEQLQQEFYKLGLSFDVFSSGERAYVNLTGLDESLEEGVALFEHVLANVVADETALQNMIAGVLKEREDAKSNPRSISSALFNYGVYGKNSPFTHKLSNEELKQVKASELIDRIKSLTSYEHYAFYYGSKEMKDVCKLLSSAHQVPKTLKPYPAAATFEQKETLEDEVIFVDYDMVQARIMMLSKDEQFTPKHIPYTRVFGEYFGSGLSSIVFQEIREKRALAYSAYSFFTVPRKKDEAHYLRAGMSVQADKMQDAITAMRGLLNDMPKIDQQFEGARTSILKQMETERITKTNKYFNYLTAKDRGLDYDVRKDVYESIENMNIRDMERFFNQHVKAKPFSFLVTGKKDELDMEYLKSLGSYKEASLDELFGY